MDGHLDLFEAMLDGPRPLHGRGSRPRTAPPIRSSSTPLSRDPEDDEAFHVILDEHQSAEGRPRLADWMRRVTR